VQLRCSYTVTVSKLFAKDQRFLDEVSR